jgi:hypothetical protein
MNYINIDDNVNEIKKVKYIGNIKNHSTNDTLNEQEDIYGINDFPNEKVIIPKKNYYCSNCNRKGHFYKNCMEPIISNGIIGIYIEDFDKNLISLLSDYLIENLKIFNTKGNLSPNYKNRNTWQDNNSKIKNYDLNGKIKFLMIQRKKSLGYLEFIRGRYNFDSNENINHLLEQMTPNEISDINNNDFDHLWHNLWDENNIKNKNHYKEYITSKQKFNQLKIKKMYLLENIKPLFAFNEWGFPKGRREMYESDLICALREFEEETCYDETQYSIIEESKYIRENLVGTNGINYAHNYFLTLLFEKNENYDKTNREIGNIKIMDINECLDVIRPYHKNKIKIIKNIYLTINNFIKEYGELNF